jgi:steroid delta-isomerase-like uncharacterized protein
MGTPSEDNVRRQREWFEAANRHDTDAMTDDYADDAVCFDHPAQQTLKGREQIRAYLASQLEAFPDVRVEEVGVIDGGEWAVSRSVLRGTHGGTFAGIEPTHRTVEVDFCNTTRWRDGKIVEDHVYYDLYTILAQLGQAEPLTAGA